MDTTQQEKKEKMHRRMEKLREIEAERSYLVVKSNILIQGQNYRIRKTAGTSLSIQQQKVMLYLISQIKPEDAELKPITMDMREFAFVCGISKPEAGGSFYDALRKNIEEMMSKIMWLVDGDKEKSAHWILDAELEKGTRMVTIFLDPKLQPYLCELSSSYTSYPLKQVIRMRSKYSIMLYELLKSFAFRRGATFTLDEFKEKMDCLGYNITNLRKRIIEPSLEEINSFTDIKVRYSFEKLGRKTHYIHFDIINLRDATDQESRLELANREDTLDAEFEQFSLFDFPYDVDEGNNLTRREIPA